MPKQLQESPEAETCSISLLRICSLSSLPCGFLEAQDVESHNPGGSQQASSPATIDASKSSLSCACMLKRLEADASAPQKGCQTQCGDAGVKIPASLRGNITYVGTSASSFESRNCKFVFSNHYDSQSSIRIPYTWPISQDLAINISNVLVGSFVRQAP